MPSGGSRSTPTTTGTSGRITCSAAPKDREVVLTRTLRQKLVELNSGLPDDAYDDALRQVVEYSATQTVLATHL